MYITERLHYGFCSMLRHPSTPSGSVFSAARHSTVEKLERRHRGVPAVTTESCAIAIIHVCVTNPTTNRQKVSVPNQRIRRRWDLLGFIALFRFLWCMSALPRSKLPALQWCRYLTHHSQWKYTHRLGWHGGSGMDRTRIWQNLGMRERRLTQTGMLMS